MSFLGLWIKLVRGCQSNRPRFVCTRYPLLNFTIHWPRETLTQLTPTKTGMFWWLKTKNVFFGELLDTEIFDASICHNWIFNSISTVPSRALNCTMLVQIQRKALIYVFFQAFFIFTPIWGRFPFWQAYFSDGLVQPQTSYTVVSLTLVCYQYGMSVVLKHAGDSGSSPYLFPKNLLYLGGGNSNICYFDHFWPLSLGKLSNLTIIFLRWVGSTTN